MRIESKEVLIENSKKEELEGITFLNLEELEENCEFLTAKIKDKIVAIRAYKKSHPFQNKFFFADDIKEDKELTKKITELFYYATRFGGLDLDLDETKFRLETQKQELEEESRLNPTNNNQRTEWYNDLKYLEEKIAWTEYLLECEEQKNLGRRVK